MGRESRFDMFIKSMDVLSKVIQRVKYAGLEKYGLKSIHFMILFYLEKAENGLTSKELINLTLEDKAAISRGIAALADKGYVNYSKKYKSRITLTEEGKRISSELSLTQEKAVHVSGEGMSEEEKEMFYRCLKLVSKNLVTFYLNMDN